MIRRILGISEPQKPSKAPEQLYPQLLPSQPAGPRYSIDSTDTPAPSRSVASHRKATYAIPSYPKLTCPPTYGGGLKLVTSTMVASAHGPQPSCLFPSLDCGQGDSRMPPYAPGYDSHGMPLPSAPPLPSSTKAEYPPQGRDNQTVVAEKHKPVAPEIRAETSTKTRPSLAEVKAVFSLARHGKYHQLAEALDAGRIAVSSKDRFGNTLLHIAAQNGFAQNGKRVLKTILRRCTMLELNAQNNQGQTPLHFAYAYKYIDCAIYLVSKGASKKLRNRDGLLPREGLRTKT